MHLRDFTSLATSDINGISYQQSGEGEMNKQIYVNLPVADLEKSKAFFAKLGYTFNAQFTDKRAAGMIVSETIYVMLVTHDFFKTLSSKEIVDASKEIEVQLAFSAGSKEEVDKIAEMARVAGSPMVKEGMMEGDFMYSRGFEDPDHHMWDFFYMDMSKMPG